MAQRLALVASDMATLLESPSPAVLSIHDRDDGIVSSPVWFRATHDAVELVIGAADRKLDLLRRDPRAVLIIFETVRPFRGIQISTTVTISPDEGATVRRAISSRYLGSEAGPRFADPGRRPPGFVIHLPLADAIAWDLRSALDGGAA